MFAELVPISALLQDEPPVSPIFLIIIAILLIILFIWLLLRERRKREAAELEAAQRLAARTESLAAPAPAMRAGSIETPRVETPRVETPVVKTPPVEVPIAPVIDDLELIEGIGPKIASILKAAGVTSFAQLAKMDPSQITTILQAANLRLADPHSWPEQARLAANGDMTALQTLQDQLKGGRRV